jgi:hypothetical protein
MLAVFDTILPIFLVLMLGKIIKTYWLTSDEFWRGTEKLSYFLLFPCALFNYIVDADLNSNELMHVVNLLIGATSLLIMGLVIYKVQAKVDGKIFTSIFQGSIRYNNYIFFAISGALYKETGLSTAAIIALYMIVFTNICSIVSFNICLNKDQNTDYFGRLFSLIKRFTLNPMIFTSLVALIFNKFEIQVGVSLKKLLYNLSGSALTMGIITVGSGMQFTIKHFEHLRTILLATFNKLVLLPIITYILFLSFNVEGTARDIGLLYSGLPCATTSYIMSKQLGGDSELMASIITFTTILSILSLSFLMYSLV